RPRTRRALSRKSQACAAPRLSASRRSLTLASPFSAGSSRILSAASTASLSAAVGESAGAVPESARSPIPAMRERRIRILRRTGEIPRRGDLVRPPLPPVDPGAPAGSSRPAAGGATILHHAAARAGIGHHLLRPRVDPDQTL